MPGLRLLLRLAPLFVGALAAAVWLRRRQAEQMPLPAPPVRPELSPAEDPDAEPVTEPTRRFARDPEPQPISIVTVVDDLLEIGRR